LWFSDGSTEGTYDLGAGCDLVTADIVVIGGKAYFACDSKLWAGDVSARNTQPVPGAPTTALAQIWGLTELGGRLAFFHRPVWGETGVSLWVTDGTEAGTRAVASLQMPSFMAPPPSLVVRGLLYFFCGDALWRSDGTTVGTRSVVQLTPRATNPDGAYLRRGPRALADVGGVLYALTNDAELWQIDAAGGHALALDGSVSYISAIAAGRSRLFYAASSAGADASLPILRLRAWGCPASS
jgi:ELWxxDGT repeat protein